MLLVYRYFHKVHQPRMLEYQSKHHWERDTHRYCSLGVMVLVEEGMEEVEAELVENSLSR
jgi:hypothetical protein